jgi:hypothetical protein
MDSWTSSAYDPYLAITAHYIDSPPHKPNDWSLKTDLLGFTEIDGNHGGANQASIMLRVIDRYDIRDKVSRAFIVAVRVTLTCENSLVGLLLITPPQMIDRAKFFSLSSIITLKVVPGRPVNAVDGRNSFREYHIKAYGLHPDAWNIRSNLELELF